MALKAFFVGNVVGGDDGIGPWLYNELKNSICTIEMIKLGVLGVDLLNKVEEDDEIIIIDAVKAEKVGKVILFEEDSLHDDMSVISQHDFGIESSIKMLRAYKNKLPKVRVIGITVREIKPFKDGFSTELNNKLERIKQEVKQHLLSMV